MEPMSHMALRAARKAGDIIVRATDELDRIEVETKGANDFVSEVDRAAEKEIIYTLSKAYPDHAFLAEEGGLTGNEDSEQSFSTHQSRTKQNPLFPSIRHVFRGGRSLLQKEAQHTADKDGCESA